MKTPKSCMNPDCPEHHPQSKPQRKGARKRWYIKYGTYISKNKGLIRRYKCTSCGRYFSDQTGAIDYYEKRSISYRRLQKELSTSTSIRAISRKLHRTPGTIQNRVSRLARQFAAALDEIAESILIQENLAMDGFESFVVSQFHPNNINLACGNDSQYVYGFSYTQINRKGRMTPMQRERARDLHDSRIASLEYQKTCFKILTIQLERIIKRSPDKQIVVTTDMNLAYTEPIMDMGEQVVHQIVSSRAVRDVNNPLFPANYFDRETRKDLSEHGRETLTHGRNVNNQLERFVIYVFTHNLHKPYRINSPVGQQHITHADVAGIPRSVVKEATRGIYKRRKLYSQVSQHLSWMSRMIWFRLLETPEEVAGSWHNVPRFVGL